MPRFSSSFCLSPHKISLCFLLYEAFQSPLLSLPKQEVLIKYIVASIKVNKVIIIMNNRSKVKMQPKRRVYLN